MYNKLMKSGIYTIINKQNGDYYLGSAVDFDRRWAVHKSLLSRNKHYNPHLQRAWNKFGEGVFEFNIILECSRDLIKTKEQEFLDKELPPYNLSSKATGHSGIITDKMRKAMRLNGLAQKGKKKPKSYSEKLSKRMIGNKLGLGKPMSPENKDKLRERNLGNKYFQGKTHTDEYKQHMSNLFKGRVFSEETRRKMSESAKLRCARQKHNGDVANHV